MTHSRRRGVALITALAILVVVGGIAALMFARTLTEVQHSGDDTGIVQSLLLARGAANLAGAVMQIPVRSQLNAIVNTDSNTVERWSFGTGTGDRPDSTSVSQVLSTNATSVANKLQTAVDDLLCDEPVPGLADGGTAALRVYFTRTACDVALPDGVDMPTGRFTRGQPRTGSGVAEDQTYALPFVVVAEGSVGPYNRTIVTSGEYEFTVGRGSFAQYALFTSVHRTPTNQEIWFTYRHLIDGPVHTNQNLRFFGPGPEQSWFGASVTSAGCQSPTPGATECPSGTTAGATFYGAGFRTVAQMESSGGMGSPSYTNAWGTHAPEFAGGVGWNADFVPLPQNTLDQRQAAANAGIAVPSGRNLSLLELVAGRVDDGSTLDEDEKNMRPLDLSAIPAEAATHQVIRLCFTEQPSGRRDLTLQDVDGASPQTPSTQIQNPRLTVCDEYRYSDVGAAAGRLETRRLVFYNSSSATWGDTTSTLVMGAVQSNTPVTDREWRWLHSDPNLTFNGVVHIDGRVDRVRGPARVPANSTDPDTAPPAVASFGQITIAAETGARITGDLKYEDVPCEGTPHRAANGDVIPARCDNLEARNILGIYSQGTAGSPGDVMIGQHNTNPSLHAPDNITIHGVLMSSTGVVGVERFNQGALRGDVNLMGGLISHHYAPFGTFNPSTGLNVNGYGRAFTFDRRTRDTGLAPPYFPGIGTDSVRDLVLFAYGQREQVE